MNSGNFGPCWSGDWINGALPDPTLAIGLVPQVGLVLVLAAIVLAPLAVSAPLLATILVPLALALALILAAMILVPPLVLTLATPPPSRAPASYSCYWK